MRRAVRFWAGVGSGCPEAVVAGAGSLPLVGVAGTGVLEPGRVATGVGVVRAGMELELPAGVGDEDSSANAACPASSSAGGWAAENPTHAAANPATEMPASSDFRTGCRSLPKPRQRAFTTLIPSLWRVTGQR